MFSVLPCPRIDNILEKIVSDLLIIPITEIGIGVHAGFTSPAMDYMEDVVSLDKEFIKHPPFTFLVSVAGDSMTGAFKLTRCLAGG